MAVYEVPLTAEAQRFNIILGGVEYKLYFSWNTVAGSWNLDIARATGEPLVNGIAVVAGLNLVGQYRYLGFTGALYASSVDNIFSSPTYNNLGGNGKVFFVTT